MQSLKGYLEYLQNFSQYYLEYEQSGISFQDDSEEESESLMDQADVYSSAPSLVETHTSFETIRSAFKEFHSVTGK